MKIPCISKQDWEDPNLMWYERQSSPRGLDFKILKDFMKDSKWEKQQIVQNESVNNKDYHSMRLKYNSGTQTLISAKGYIIRLKNS